MISKATQRRVSRILFPWTVGGITGIAALIRLVHISDRSLSLAEAVSWRFTQFPFLEFLQRAAADTHPAGYYVLLRVWLESGVPDSTFWMRFLSVILATLGVLAMYWAGSALFRSRWVGLTAALLTAVSAFQVPYAWEASMYSLGLFLFPVCLALLIKTLRVRKPGWAAWYGALFGISAAAFLHTHYYALFSIAALAAGTVGYFAWRTLQRRTNVFRYSHAKAAIGGVFLALLLFIPWVPVLRSQYAAATEQGLIMDERPIFNTIARMFVGSGVPFERTAAVIAALVAGGILLAALIAGKSKEDMLVTLCFVAPFIGAFFVPAVPHDRYFAFASLALILLTARAISFIPRSARTAVLGVLVMGGMWSTVALWQSMPFSDSSGARSVAQHLVRNVQNEEAILVFTPSLYLPILFHVQEQAESGLNLALYSGHEGLMEFSGYHVLTANDIVGMDVCEHSDVCWTVHTDNEPDISDDYTLRTEQRFPGALNGDAVVRTYQRATASP